MHDWLKEAFLEGNELDVALEKLTAAERKLTKQDGFLLDLIAWSYTLGPADQESFKDLVREHKLIVNN